MNQYQQPTWNGQNQYQQTTQQPTYNPSYNQTNENSQGNELGWEDTITQDAKDFIVLDEGNYPFTVKNFSRARHPGSTKMPPCNMAVITIEIQSPKGPVSIKSNLFLHSKMEWKLSQFFTCIGLKKDGVPFVMNWNSVYGTTGTCHIAKTISKNGNTYNEVKNWNKPASN